MSLRLADMFITGKNVFVRRPNVFVRLADDVDCPVIVFVCPTFGHGSPANVFVRRPDVRLSRPNVVFLADEYVRQADGDVFLAHEYVSQTDEHIGEADEYVRETDEHVFGTHEHVRAAADYAWAADGHVGQGDNYVRMADVDDRTKARRRELPLLHSEWRRGPGRGGASTVPARALLLFFEQLFALSLVFVLGEGAGVMGFLEVDELLVERAGVVARLARIEIAHRDDATRKVRALNP